jgi:hypothetical protein
MRARVVFSLCFAATALVGCTETLRVPPPTGSTSGAAGASATGYAVLPASAGGGLASGAAAASGPGGPSTMGFGGGVGTAPMGGMGATGGGAMTGAGGTAGGPDPSTMTSPSGPWAFEGRGKYNDLGSAPISMSRNGNRVLEAHGLLWIDEGTPVPTLTPTLTPPQAPIALSADGSTVIGQVVAAPSLCPVPTAWTRGMPRSWPPLGLPIATSADGISTIATSPLGCMPSGMRAVVLSDVSVAIEPLPGDDATEGLALTPDGKRIFVFSSTHADGMGRIFSWTAGQVFSPSSTKIRLQGFRAFASADGKFLAGTQSAPSGGDAAFFWGGSNPMALPTPPSRGQSLAAGLSDDGSVVLALGTNVPVNGPSGPEAKEGLPYTWSAASGPTFLAVPPGVMAFTTVFMTPDASLIVGNPAPPMHGMPVVVWDAQRAPGFLFGDAPMFLQRCNPVVTHVSADGKTFAGACAGNGGQSGFVARF